MRLLLVQHGLSLPKEVDPERGLSPEGIEVVERMAEVAKDHGVQVSSIKHSGKKRALQTADIFGRALSPAGGIQKISGIDPLDDVSDFASTLVQEDSLMLVGHLPFMERLTSHLIAGSAEIPVFKFQNSGIVCLQRNEGSKNWTIVWTLMPNIG